jgi:hypothetical protein
MRQIIGLLATTTLAVGIFGGPRDASAAAFLAINGGNWSYSAALAQSPAGTAYYWGLSIGVGSVSYAYAYSYRLPFGAAAAYAVARAGFGWRGAWYFAGIADPQGDMGLGIPDISPISLSSLVNSADSTDLASEVTALASASPGPSGYTIDHDTNGEIDGITFNPGANDSASVTNATETLALLVVNSSAETDFCNAIGDTGCAAKTAQTNANGDVTSISGLLGDLGTDVLGSEIVVDPTLSGTLNFADIPGSSRSSDIIFVERSALVPEPSTWAMMLAGFVGLGFAAYWRKSPKSATSLAAA